MINWNLLRRSYKKRKSSFSLRGLNLSQTKDKCMRKCRVALRVLRFMFPHPNSSSKSIQSNWPRVSKQIPALFRLQWLKMIIKIWIPQITNSIISLKSLALAIWPSSHRLKFRASIRGPNSKPIIRLTRGANRTKMLINYSLHKWAAWSNHELPPMKSMMTKLINFRRMPLPIPIKSSDNLKSAVQFNSQSQSHSNDQVQWEMTPINS